MAEHLYSHKIMEETFLIPSSSLNSLVDHMSIIQPFDLDILLALSSLN